MTGKPPQGQQWEQMWLPGFPYASNDLKDGIYRMKREPALERLYIEANPKALSNLLVVDIDHDDARLRCMWDRHDWLPNAIIENPENGHAHAVWALREPVTRTEYASRKPLAYAASVVEGLRRSVDGDQGYSGLMTKNPTHDAWDAHWLTDELYSLPQLHEHLDTAGFMPAPTWRRSKRRDPVGLGRNCAIFETVRLSSYRELRHYFGDPVGLGIALRDEVNSLNAAFSEPLPASECKAIANSIHKWILKSRMWQDGPVVYAATFSTIQAARGRKGGRKGSGRNGGVASGAKRRENSTTRSLILEAINED